MVHRVLCDTQGKKEKGLANRLLTGYFFMNLGIERMQAIGAAGCVLHARVQPQIVVFRLEDHGHSIMDWRNQSVGLGRENCARFDTAAWSVVITSKADKGVRIPVQ